MGRLCEPLRSRPAAALMLLVGCLGLVSMGPAPAPAAAAYGDVTLFARIPDPGHPFGVLATDTHVYVVTSRGFHVETAGDGERLFTFSRSGEMIDARRIDPSMPDMGFYGLALDGEDRLYTSDMNGRVLRYGLAAGLPTGQQEVYARKPFPYAVGMEMWETAMWNGIAFDRAGTLWVADNNAAVWRIPAGGEPEVWFRDPRLAGAVAGPFGAALGPDGKLYVVVLGPTVAGQPGASVIYRLPLDDRPTPADLEEFHVFRGKLGEFPALASAIAFGRSGRAYVTLSGTAEVAVLSPGGTELRRIPLPGVNEPLSISFLGRSLLVTSATNFFPIDDPQSWKIAKVAVDEPGMALIRPEL